MQNFEFRKSDHHRPSDRDINDGNKDRKTDRNIGADCRTKEQPGVNPERTEEVNRSSLFGECLHLNHITTNKRFLKRTEQSIANLF